MEFKFITQSRIWAYLQGSSNVKKQFIKFVLIGSTAVLADLSVYYILLNLFPEKIIRVNNEVYAKAISFVCGMAVTYTFNKYWTWKIKTRSNVRVIKFVVLYGTSMLINVGVNSALIAYLHKTPFYNDIPFKYLIAFIGATGISSIMNFAGQKFWVFKS